jgi:hypothetical protein
MNHRFNLLAGLCLGSVAFAQNVVDQNGNPDPNYPNLWAWYSADNGLNGNTSPLPSGTSVNLWSDRSYNGRDLTLVSNDQTRWPVAVDDMGSCGPALQFDGNDYLWGSTTTIGRCTGPRTIFIVARTDVADGGYLFDGSTSSGRTALFSGQTATPETWHAYWSDSTQPSPNGFIMISTPAEKARYQLHTLRVAPGQQEHWIDGQLVTSAADPSEFNLGGLILGSRFNTANALRGAIREVVVYQESLGAIDQLLIEGYLLGRHPYGHGSNYGQGCAGSSGQTPTLAAYGCPTPGASFELRVTDGAVSSPCIINFGLTTAAIPIDANCTLLTGTQLASVAGLADASGAFAFPLAIPAGIPQVLLTTQAITVDPPASIFGIAASNGVELRIY